MTGYIIPDDWDGVTYQEYCLKWPASDDWAALLRGALAGFYFPYVWDESTGDATAAAATGSAIVDLNTVGEQFPEVCEGGQVAFIVGQIMWFGLTSAEQPDKWVVCDGGELSAPIELRSALINAGYPFGSGVSGDCGIEPCPLLPDLIGLFPRGAYSPGGTGGLSQVTLSVDEMPQHNHPPGAGDGFWNWHNVNPGTVDLLSGSGFKESSATSGSGFKGGSQPHENKPPYLEFLPLIYGGEDL